MTDTGLPLDSPRWSTLADHAGDVPALLATLFERRSLSLDEEYGPWHRLFDRIYHQMSLYDATFAAMPHLVRLAAVVSDRDRWELCSTFGMIGSALLFHAPVIPPDLAGAFRVAIDAAASLTVRVLASEPLQGDEAQVLLFGALALASHPAGRLVDSNLRPPLPAAECECPACGENYFAYLFADGVARTTSVYAHPTVPDPGQPAFQLPQAPRSAERTDTPWSVLAASFDAARSGGRALDGSRLDDRSPEVAVCLEIAASVCAEGIDPQTAMVHALVVAAAVQMLHGHTDHGRALLRLVSTVRCPTCDAVAPLFSQLLDFVDT